MQAKDGQYDITDSAFVNALFRFVSNEICRICSEESDPQKAEEELKGLGFYLSDILTGQLSHFKPEDPKAVLAVEKRLAFEMKRIVEAGGAPDPCGCVKTPDGCDWAMSASTYIVSSYLKEITGFEENSAGETLPERLGRVSRKWTAVILG